MCQKTAISVYGNLHVFWPLAPPGDAAAERIFRIWPGPPRVGRDKIAVMKSLSQLVLARISVIQITTVHYTMGPVWNHLGKLWAQLDPNCAQNWSAVGLAPYGYLVSGL